MARRTKARSLTALFPKETKAYEDSPMSRPRKSSRTSFSSECLSLNPKATLTHYRHQGQLQASPVTAQTPEIQTSSSSIIRRLLREELYGHSVEPLNEPRLVSNSLPFESPNQNHFLSQRGHARSLSPLPLVGDDDDVGGGGREDNGNGDEDDDGDNNECRAGAVIFRANSKSLTESEEDEGVVLEYPGLPERPGSTSKRRQRRSHLRQRFADACGRYANPGDHQRSEDWSKRVSK